MGARRAVGFCRGQPPILPLRETFLGSRKTSPRGNPHDSPSGAPLPPKSELHTPAPPATLPPSGPTVRILVCPAAASTFLGLSGGPSEFICVKCLGEFLAQGRCSVHMSYCYCFWAFFACFSSLPPNLPRSSLEVQKSVKLTLYSWPQPGTYYTCREPGRH